MATMDDWYTLAKFRRDLVEFDNTRAKILRTINRAVDIRAVIKAKYEQRLEAIHQLPSIDQEKNSKVQERLQGERDKMVKELARYKKLDEEVLVAARLLSTQHERYQGLVVWLSTIHANSTVPVYQMNNYFENYKWVKFQADREPEAESKIEEAARAIGCEQEVGEQVSGSRVSSKGTGLSRKET